MATKTATLKGQKALNNILGRFKQMRMDKVCLPHQAQLIRTLQQQTQECADLQFIPATLTYDMICV